MRDYNDLKQPVWLYVIMAVLCILQIVFITLRFCNVINWNWWIVMLPMIVPFGLLITLTITAILVEIIRSGDDEEW